MKDLCRDLIAVVAAAEPINGGNGQADMERLRDLAERARRLFNKREQDEIDLEAVEANIAARETSPGALPEG